MKSSVTIAICEGISSGPWIYWNNLEENAARAGQLGFDAIELFSTNTGPAFRDEVAVALQKHRLDLSAVGTGAGKVLQGLTLTDPDPSVRKQARAFIRDVIAFGAAFNAPAIIGSMQGFCGGRERNRVLALLKESLDELGTCAGEYGVPLIYEPLNRYETDLFNKLGETVSFIEENNLDNVMVLADLFHMNIEEPSLTDALDLAMRKIGHVHFADSNRHPAGCGHTDFTGVAEVLGKHSYDRYVSAEAFPYPDSDKAAEMTIASYNRLFAINPKKN